MSAPIDTYLRHINEKEWASEVRAAIVNAIRECYNNTEDPELRTDALEAAIQVKIDTGQMAALTIGDETITAVKLANNSVTTSKIADGNVTTPKIADGSITQEKLDPNMELVTIDATLSHTGEAADAKATGDAIAEINGSLENLNLRLSDDSISLLKYVLEHVAYTTDDMRSHVDDLIVTLKGDAILKGGAYIPKKVIRGAYINEYGEIVEASTGSGYFEEFIKIPDSISGELCGCYSDSNRNYRISEYDEDKNFIKQTTGNNYNFAITLDTDTVYVRFGFYTQNATTPVFSVGVPDLQDAVDLDVEIGDISNTTGEEITEPKRARSGEIEVDSNVVSVYGCFWAPTYPKWHRSALYAIRCYDASDTYLGASDSFNADVTNLTLPEGTKIIRFIFQKSGSNIVITPAYYPMWVNGIKYKMQEVS